jgi:hypothetical protein
MDLTQPTNAFPLSSVLSIGDELHYALSPPHKSLSSECPYPYSSEAEVILLSTLLSCSCMLPYDFQCFFCHFYQLPPCDDGDVRAHVKYGAAIFTPLSYEGHCAPALECHPTVDCSYCQQRPVSRASHILTRASCARSVHALLFVSHVFSQFFSSHDSELVCEPGT